MNQCKHVFFIIVLLHFFSTSFAQDFSNKGREFWVLFPPHSPSQSNLANLSLYISSDRTSSGYIVVNGDSTRFSIEAFTPKEFILNRATTYVSGAESASDASDSTIKKIVLNKGIKVIVDDGKPNVVVYAHMYASARSAASIILPTSVLERRYQAITYTQSPTGIDLEPRKSQFSVIAVEDNTTIRIQLRKNGQLSGTSFEINLPKAGTIYSFQDNADLTGTSIESVASNGNLCKKIAVFSGSSSLGIGATTSVDPLFQQCYPMNSWGLNYFITPFAGKNKFIVRILAKEDNTRVVLDGKPAIKLNANEFYESAYSSPLPFSVNADKAICVAQFSYTQSVDIGVGDPDMVILNSVEQNLNDVTVFLTSKNKITDQNINVVIKNEGIPSFKINGQLPTGVFKKIPNTNYAYLQEKFVVDTGSFLSVRLSSDSGFNAFCYGFGSYESYMYSAGTNVKDLFQKLLITNKFASVTSEAVTCIGAPFIASITLPYKPVTIKWKIPNLAQIDDLAPKPKDSVVINNKTVYTYQLSKDLIFDTKGVYNLKVIVNNPTFDGCSGEQEISFDLEVIGPPDVKNKIISSNCLADSARFVDQTILKPTDRKITNYKWDIGKGVFLDRLAAFNYKFDTAGQYEIKYFLINDIGCISDTIVTTLLIDRNPTVQFEISSIRCQKEPISFKDQSSSSGNTILKQWVWNYGDTNPRDTLLSSQTVKHTFDTAKTYDVTLSLTTANGCQSNLIKSFVNHPKPLTGFIMPKICLEDEFALFVDTTKMADNSKGLRYKWNFGDLLNTRFPNTDTVASPKHRYLSPGTYKVSLEVTSLATCVNSISNDFTVNGSIPRSTFAVINDTALCSNQSVQIINQSKVDIGTVGKLIIYWDYNRNPTDTTMDESPIEGKKYRHDYTNYHFPDKTNFNIKLIAYSGANCFDDTTISIAIVPPPQSFNITSSKNYACSLDTLKFSPIITGGAAPFQTIWTSSNNQFGQFNGQVLNGIAQGNIKISVSVTDSKKCVYDYPAFKDIDVRSIPLASLVVKDTVICNGDPVTLKGSGAITYHWYLDGLILKTTAQDTLLTNLPGKYQLTVNDGFCNSIKTATIKVKSLTIPKYKIDYAPYTCLNNELLINTDAKSQDNVYFLWDFGDMIESKLSNPSSHVYMKTGVFKMKLAVTNDYCPLYQYELIGNTVTVVAPLPPSTYTLFVLGDVDTLLSPKKIDSGYTSYYWSPAQFLSNPSIPNPLFRSEQSIDYTLLRTDPVTECTIADVYKIVVSIDVILSLPKAFSPNGDNLNDILKIEYGAGIKSFGLLRIFNRYGKIVFQTNKINEGWDGKLNGIDQEIDAYSYFVDFVTYRDQRISKTGSFILLR